MLKVMSVFGTRPEAVKMCPLVKELEQCKEIESVVCLSGQHREMLHQVIDVFGIMVKYNLDIMKLNQTLATITTDILQGLEPILAIEKPDLVLVHGDTTTSFAAALAAFYQKIPVGHVEAGLRTYNNYLPYPEEVNRNLTGRIAELHFAPTKQSMLNLYNENIRKNVFITGNTVIDAFKTTVRSDYAYHNRILQNLVEADKPYILITAHRRENLGEPLENICKAIKKLAVAYENMNFIYPVHPNPAIKRIVDANLLDIPNVHILEPLDVLDMHNLLSKCYLVLTDSGGLQEEAPYWGIPVLVLRNETERPEAVEAGVVKIVGTDETNIIMETEKLLASAQLYDNMAQAISPYGDGHASEKIINYILEWKHD